MDQTPVLVVSLELASMHLAVLLLSMVAVARSRLPAVGLLLHLCGQACLMSNQLLQL
jgi:hypothetical protein